MRAGDLPRRLLRLETFAVAEPRLEFVAGSASQRKQDHRADLLTFLCICEPTAWQPFAARATEPTTSRIRWGAAICSAGRGRRASARPASPGRRPPGPAACSGLLG